MRFNKLFLAGSILVLGLSALGLDAYAQGNTTSAGQAAAARRQFRNQAQNRFMDQDCDGINDNFRDHDNDGIPNGQDPDWAPPKDGTGYKNRNGRTGVSGNGNGSGLNKSSFRGRGAGPGSGICDGTGPHGKSVRKGRG